MLVLKLIYDRLNWLVFVELTKICSATSLSVILYLRTLYGPRFCWPAVISILSKNICSLLSKKSFSCPFKQGQEQTIDESSSKWIWATYVQILGGVMAAVWPRMLFRWYFSMFARLPRCQLWIYHMTVYSCSLKRLKRSCELAGGKSIVQPKMAVEWEKNKKTFELCILFRISAWTNRK